MKVVARRRRGFTHDIEIEGGHRMVIDEPEDAGGANEGPSPTRTLGAALASCTAITCEMYAERKGWELGDVEVDVEIEYDPGRGTAKSFEVTLRVAAPLDDDQRRRLLVIAAKCPVHRVIAGETPVEITDRVERLASAG